MNAQPNEAEQRQRTMWSAGDYRSVATTIEGVSEAAVEAAGVGPGQLVLDVATGTGNAALAAARRSAQVTGLDLTPSLLEIARERAAEEQFLIEFDEGTAEHLPYLDHHFDVVTSVFGAMFSPNHRAAADELRRVCKPGGTIAVTAWTPEGLNGQMFAVLGRHLPPPPPGFQPPILWGVEDHVRGLFPGAEVHCERRRATIAVETESVDAWLDEFETQLGPLVVAKQLLEPQGKWQDVRTELTELYDRFDEGRDGTFHVEPEYLLTVVR